MLSYAKHIFVQNEESLLLLQQYGINHCSVSGDTRFDRVKATAAQRTENAIVQSFSDGKRLIAAGSTWPEDEDVLLEYMRQAPADVCMLIAPHEITKTRIKKLMQRAAAFHPVCYSTWGHSNGQKRILIIDNVGLLSSLYRYAVISYIGGAFGKGLHNILEAAAYGCPVIYGPNRNKFREAIELEHSGGAFSISETTELTERLNWLLADKMALRRASEICRMYVMRQAGATQRVMERIFSE